MRDHRESLAVDALFARVMEVQLRELVPLVTNGDEAAGRVVDLNRVAVVDDVETRGQIGLVWKYSFTGSSTNDIVWACIGCPMRSH
jgi:hypothetical protein